MEGRICFEYRWGLKPVLVYALCHTKPIFDFDYIINGLIHRTICHRVSAAICFGLPICHRWKAAICIGRPICLCSSIAICIDQSICHRWRAAIRIGQPICHPESAAICIDYTNMPPSSIWFTKGPWPKKGTPLRFRAKKGHTGNEILVREKIPRNFLQFFFRCSTWVAHKNLFVFGQKRVQFNGNKGYSSTRIEKRGTPLRFRAKRGHTAVSYVVQN